MIRTKNKITRKEIREDKLVTFYYKAVAFVEEYKRQLGIGVAAVALIALAGYLYMNNKKSNNEKANVELARVMKLYDNGAYQEAISGRPGTNIIGLKKIAEEYGSTDNGQAAKIYLANAYFFLGKFDDAEKAYDDYSGSSELFKASAYAGLAGCYENKNKYEDAAEYYTKAAKVSSVNILNPQYLLNAGINLLKAGKKEEAKELLESVKREYAKSLYIRDVDRYLAQIY